MYTVHAFPAVVKRYELWPSFHSFNSSVPDSKKFPSHCIGRMSVNCQLFSTRLSRELGSLSYTKRFQILCYCRQSWKLGRSSLRAWNCALLRVVPRAPRIGVLVFLYVTADLWNWEFHVIPDLFSNYMKSSSRSVMTWKHQCFQCFPVIPNWPWQLFHIFY